MLNRSLSTGDFPSRWKEACIFPTLKKGNVNAFSVTSYRPISNLPVLSKLLEKVVSTQLLTYLNDCNLFPTFQSAYRPHHSAETVLLHLLSDIYKHLDKRHVSLLSFLDMSSAFDCVDHAIVLHRLRVSFGLSDVVIKWFTSFLHDRKFYVRHISSTKLVPLSYGVPQGSVLGPILFTLYISELIPLVQNHDLCVHLFADDILLYGFSSPQNSNRLVSRISSCISSVKEWLKSNRLLLNSEKTHLMWCHSPRLNCPFSTLPIHVDGSTLNPVKSVRYLGVVLDSNLSFSTNISKTVSSCFSALRRIRSIRSSITRQATVTLITALVASRIDYCIAAHAGLPSTSLWRLQRVLHASARLVFRTKRHDSVSLLLRKLGWLSVSARIQLRVASIAYLCNKGMAPSYLVRETTPVSSLRGRLRLRSASSDCFAAPLVRHPTLGGRAFAAVVAATWNRVPAEIKNSESLQTFKICFKKFLLDLMHL